MSSTSSIFSGSSRYSTDLQSVITRAVSIASLPKTQMENTLSTLQSESSALDTIDTKFEAVQSAISSLASATVATSSSVSNASVARATVSESAMAGTYEITVTDLGSFSASLSADGLTTVTDPETENISSASSFTLTVDGEEFTIAPAGTSLSDLADAINSSGAAVEATIVNVGSTSSPDYRLSLRSTALGEAAIQLNDGTSDLLDTISTGSLATYTLNGKSVTTDSRTVTVGPGLEVTLRAEGTTEITVGSDTSSLSSALSTLVSAYNAALAELDTHRGEEGGALEGSSLLYSLSASLRELVGYDTGEDGIRSLTSLGLTYKDDGTLSFDTSAFEEAVSEQQAAVLDFLGAADSGGFLKFATDLMDGLEDGTTGLITTQQDSLADQISDQSDRIDEEQERIDALEEQLNTQMAAADAAIAELELQVNYITSLFESMSSLSDSYNQ
jgi:flagellar hook-associated protein 2